MTTDTQAADAQQPAWAEVWADASSGMLFGSGLVAGAIFAMRPLLPSFGEPSVANALLLSLVILLAAVVLGRAIFDHTMALPGRWITLPLAGIILTGIASLGLTSHQWPTWLEALAWVTNGIFFVCIYALCASPEDRGRAARRAVVAALLATAGVMALYGIYQKLAVMPHLLDTMRGDERGRELLRIPGAIGRVTSGEVYATFVTPNAFAGYLALVLPAAVGVAAWGLIARRRAAAGAAIVLAVLLGMALLFTGSPGGFVAAAVGAIAMVALLHGKRIRDAVARLLPAERGKRVAAIVGGVVACVLVVIILIWASMSTPSMRTRAEYWKATAAMVADNPLGVGLGNFEDRYPQYKTPAGWETREAHNVYLGLLAEAGPLCLVLFGLLVYGVVRTLARAAPLPTAPEKETSPGPARLGILVLAGGVSGLLAAYVIGAMLGSGVHSSAIVEWLRGSQEPMTFVTAVVHIAFIFVWAVLFLVLFDADVDTGFVRAGLVGGLCALAVHGLVEFDFEVKTTMLAAAAIGAVALSAGASYRPSFKGARTAIPAVCAAAVLVPLFLFGSLKVWGLWELTARADKATARAEALEDAAREVAQAAVAGEYDEILSLLAGLDEPAMRVRMADLRDAVSLAHTPRVRRAASDFASQARREARGALSEAWDLTGTYLAEVPGDVARVASYMRLAEMLKTRRVRKNTDAPVERAIRLLTARAPHSSSAWTMLGRHQADAGHLTAAAASFREAANMYPLDPETWLRAGDAAVFFDADRAEAAYEKAIAANRIVEDENTSLFAKLWAVRPVRPNRPDQLVKLEERTTSAPFVFRTGLMFWEIGGYAEAAKRFDKALELRPGDVQFAAFKALLLRLEMLREESDDAVAAADAAWDEFVKLQEEAPPAKRLNDGIVRLFQHRTRAMGKAARGERW